MRAESAGGVVYEQSDALYWKMGSTIQASKLSDTAHYEKIDRSGSSYYVVLRFDDQHTWLTVFQCDSVGRLQVTHNVVSEKLNPVTAILGASFLADGRLFIDTHVNPRQGVAVTVDLISGNQTIRETGND